MSLIQDFKSNAFLVEVQSAKISSEINHSNAETHEDISSQPPTLLTTGVSSSANISEFLSRKVLIHTETWANGAALNLSLAPWQLYLTNAVIDRKLTNYNLLKANMKITIYINGTPFHVGMALAAYNYMNTPGAFSVPATDQAIINRSQKPHIYLNASTCKGGCICVPFFFPQPFLSLTNPSVTAGPIGILTIDSFNNLVQVNGTDDVTLSVFVELEDVVLSGPTQAALTVSSSSSLDFDSLFQVECQSSSGDNDEYEKEGVISGKASAVANLAGQLSVVPIIRPFALATQMGASAVADIARLFGYSKPVQTSDVSFVKNSPFTNFALTEGADSAQKLTITGKQELTIDSRTVGFDGTDDLALKNMTTRETYLTGFEWPVTAIQTSYLFSIDVDPMAEFRTNVVGGVRILPTSLSFTSRLFSAWTGSIVYRFQVVASQYHRGKIAIIYDPTGPSFSGPYQSSFHTIVDISETRDFSIVVNWQSNTAFKQIDGAIDNRGFYTTAAPDTRTVNTDYSNGVLYVQCLNQLTTPDSTTPAQILVSVKAGDDFQLMNPTSEGIRHTHLRTPEPTSAESDLDFNSLFSVEVQSAAVEILPEEENAPEGTVDAQLTLGAQMVTPSNSIMFYGETIQSLRQLLKRTCHYVLISFTTGNSNEMQLSTTYIPAFPISSGYDPGGGHTTGAARSYWYTSVNYISYIKRYFAGWRGGIRHRFVPIYETNTMFATRSTGDEGRNLAIDFGQNELDRLTVGRSVRARAGTTAFNRTPSGAAATVNSTMNCLEIEMPFTVPTKFSSTHGSFTALNTNTRATNYPGGDMIRATLVAPELIGGDIGFNCFISAGEDFTFFGVVGAPTMYGYVDPAA